MKFQEALVDILPVVHHLSDMDLLNTFWEATEEQQQVPDLLYLSDRFETLLCGELQGKEGYVKEFRVRLIS